MADGADEHPPESGVIQSLERKLRHIRRALAASFALIEGANSTDDSFFQFLANLEGLRSDWAEYQGIWHTLDPLYLASGAFPKEWENEIDRLRNAMRKAEGLCLKLKAEREKAEKADATVVLSAGPTNISHNHLPQIKVPTFNGDLSTWTHFRDTFTSLVHDNTSLSSVSKMHYLRDALVGEPATLLAGLTFDARSYQLAWDSLMREYDNPRVLASRHIQKILNFKYPTSGSEYSKYNLYLSQVAESIEAFHALALESESEVLLSILALRALDPNTRRQFELAYHSNEFPSSDEVVAFVRQRMMACKLSNEFQACPNNAGQQTRPKSSSKRPTGFSFFANKPSRAPLSGSVSDSSQTSKESSAPNRCSSSPKLQSPSRKKRISKSNRSPASNRPPSSNTPCLHCKGNHSLFRCFAFSQLSVDERLKLIKSSKRCLNCLEEGHFQDKCHSKFSCRFCGAKHHSLLHSERPGSPTRQEHEAGASFSGHARSANLETSVVMSDSLIGTACAVVDGPKRSHTVRLILDSGSQYTFVTSQVASALDSSIRPFNGRITGLNGSAVNNIKGWISLRLRSALDSGINFKATALVVDHITSNIPRRPIPNAVVQQLSGYVLADPSFGQPGIIDMLIGVDLYPKIITGAPVRIHQSELYVMPSVFGNVVIGALPGSPSPDAVALLAQDDSDLLQQLKAFWETEEPKDVDRNHPDDVYCENHFSETHLRTPEGRYVVRLPIKPCAPPIGSNRQIALKRFYSLERKLGQDEGLKGAYAEFMNEYLTLGHMTSSKTSAPYVIPHHGVWQTRPTGAKLRVVFDASCHAGSASLNEALLSGPKLQSNLSLILTRFRLFPIAISGDLVKMYRQVLVHPDDRHLQHIFWRDDPSSPLVEYELNTVTYGERSSSFLAIRSIQQLFTDEGCAFPLAVRRLSDSIYVDDFATGADSIQEARELVSQIKCLFSKGCLEVGKWSSNIPTLVPESEGVHDVKEITQEGHPFIKILGLTWSPNEDNFSFVVQKAVKTATKRVILSHIARVFDPLGFLSPVIFYAKTILKDVWRQSLSWDEPLLDTLSEKWSLLIDDWPTLCKVQIPRYIQASGSQLQLVGFSDASEQGYAAVVYARVVTLTGAIHAFLLQSKTKVAPSKFKTIPQLELCGALLLVRLMSSINIETHCPLRFYTDSSVVLAWLRTPIYKLKVFEANRVSAILESSDLHQWHFVRSEFNPADIASRGCLPSDLLNSEMWFRGPPWLSDEHLPEFQSCKPVNTFLVQSTSSDPPCDDSWLSRFSCLQRLVRVTARLIRLSKRIHNRSVHLEDPVSGEEYSHALLALSRLVQRATLPPSLYGSPIPKQFHQLSPFLDELGILRVGGRIRHSGVEHDRKHPILLPKTHHFTRLVIDDLHISNFHAGPTLLLSLLRAKFWVPSALKLIKSRIYQCVHCRIRRAKPVTPIMSDLPPERFETHRAFSQVGVDYAGPFLLKESNRRKPNIARAYLCLFVCFATKAVHLELVSSLSTDAFLASLDRFIARRGLPSCIHSDNGTNFVGASRALREFYSFLNKNSETWANHLTSKAVEWKLIPPRAPHFGGLWEAGVKSVKALLVNAVGRQPMTFEELQTVLAKIEALLNSRPLCPLREDAEDFDFLTPGHFLIGSQLKSIPTFCEDGPKLGISARWRLVQQQVAHIWSRWHRDYLHQLQQRTKWTAEHPNLAVGDLVIMVEGRVPAGLWPVARVAEVFPGRDGVVRVVSVRTPSSKVFKRPVTSLVPLFATTESQKAP